MGAVGGHELLERDAQLARLVDAVADGEAGVGSLVVVEGATGLGKSRLLSSAAVAASEETLVLHASCEELERMRPWALIRLLFTQALGQRAFEPHDAAAPAAALLGASGDGSLGTAFDDPLPLIHSLFWLTADLAADAPLLLVIDDAHWADQPSLRFVRYLLPRLADLPITVLIARRAGEPIAERAELDAIAGDPRVAVVELAPLSEQAVGQLLRDQLGTDAGAEMINACSEVTGGNPFYLGELARELRAGRDAGDLPSPQTVRQIRPASVARTVFLRLSRLGADAGSLARAVAVLGDRAAFPHAAELSGLQPEQASKALDALAGAEILKDREPLTFVHPLVAGAIYGDVPCGARGDLHARAAKLLGRDGATQEEVASQLLLAGRRADPWAVEALVAAAAHAVSQGGVAAAAAQYLERALEEPPPVTRRGEVLAALGRAEALLGRPQAIQRFTEALPLTHAGPARAQLALELGRSLGGAGQHQQAAATFRGGLDELADPASELHRELHTAWVMSASLNPDTAAILPDSPAVDPDLPPTPGQRQLLTLTALQRAFEGAPRGELVALAERAWDGGGLLEGDAGVGMSWSLLTTVYCVADELERELEVCDAMLREARRRGSPMAFATVSYCRAFPLLHQGRIDEAVADVQAAVDAREDGWSVFLGSAAACLALGHLERGALPEARAALALVQDDPALQASLEYLLILGAQGCLLLAENRPQEALEPLLRAEQIGNAAGIRASVAFPWQSVASIAASLAGQQDLGDTLAREALATARTQGAPRAIAHALRACGCASQSDEAIGYFEAAVNACDDGQPRLQQTHALVDLGAALRRAHRRADAREPLRRGLALATAGGAHALADRARTELAAAGAHVPSHTRSGVESLTPSERRVAELAAAGHSNRAIAQSLFVTVKAVEYHLANAYRKLGIKGRRGLGPLLEKSRSDRPGPAFGSR